MSVYRFSHQAKTLLESRVKHQGREFVFILTRLELVLLVSSSGMGRNTAKATQFAKMVSRMIISKVLMGKLRIITTILEKNPV